MTGAGTSGDPYIIYDIDDLQAMKDSLAAYYELANNIDASATSGWNKGAGFIPVGAVATPFTGQLAGKRHKITDLYINRPTTNYVGFFGVCSAIAVVKNVHLVDVNITGQDEVGGFIANKSPGDNFDYCSVTGQVSGRRIVGGFAGTLGHARYCFVRGTVHATGQAGQDTWCGGFAGQCINSIRDSYSRANVSVDTGSKVGGFSGGCSASGGIHRCYSTGTVTGQGFNGYFDQTTDCYWDEESSGVGTSVGGTGLTTAEAKTQGSYTSWDFTDIWVIDSAIEDGYPSLQVLVSGWGNEEIIQAATAQYSSPVLSVDGAKIYCFWAGSPAADHIYYKKICPAIDVDPTDWIDESFDGLTFDGDVACNAESGSYIGVQDEIDAGVGLYIVRHHYLIPPVAVGHSQGYVIG